MKTNSGVGVRGAEYRFSEYLTEVEWEVFTASLSVLSLPVEASSTDESSVDPLTLLQGWWYYM